VTVLCSLNHDACVMSGNDSKRSIKGMEAQKTTNVTMNLEKLDVEFAKVIGRIKQALCQSNVNVHSLIEKLCTISAVKHKKVPLFDEDVFQKVTTVEELWRRMRSFWSILDYDILIYVLDITDCKEANEIFKKFMSTIDSASLKDVDLVLSCKEYEGEGLKPLLRIKISEKQCTQEVQEKVKELVSKKFNLHKYSLCFKTIKEGCIELLYEVSNTVSSYLLQCGVTEHDLIELAAYNIIHLQIGSKKWPVPSVHRRMVGNCK